MPENVDREVLPEMSADERRARELAARKGYIYWPGGDEAPADWDGGVYLCRDGKEYWMCGYGWGHGTNCWNPTASWDRIGYRARAASLNTHSTEGADA